jgi:superfamily II DNA helicase RecQ
MELKHQRSGCYLYFGYKDTATLKRMIDAGDGNGQQKARQKHQIGLAVITSVVAVLSAEVFRKIGEDLHSSAIATVLTILNHVSQHLFLSSMTLLNKHPGPSRLCDNSRTQRRR